MVDPGKRSYSLLLPLGIIVGVIAGSLVWYQRTKEPGEDGNRGGSGVQHTDFQDSLELHRVALAATENMDADAAEQAWSSLYSQSPDDEAICLNRALNRVLKVESLAERAGNANLTTEEKQDARRQLPEAIASARGAIGDYAKTSQNVVRPLWLRTRVDLTEASLLPSSMTKSIRKEVFERLSSSLTESLGDVPESISLVGPLISVLEQLEDPRRGLPTDIQTNAARTLASVSNKHPRNLFLSLKAAQLNLAEKSPDAIDIVNRTGELTVSIQPSLKRQTEPIGLTPSGLVQEIIDLASQEEWDKAKNRMQLWFNVLNGTSLVKTDRRRASPHPLDRLSFDSLRRISSEFTGEQSEQVPKSDITFNTVALDTEKPTSAIATIDYDLDLFPDLISASSDGEIVLHHNIGENDSSASNWKMTDALRLEHSVSGFVVADLFMVDSSHPSRVQVKRSSEDGQHVSSSRHNSFVSALAYGKDGVALMAVNGNANSESPLSIVEKDTGLENLLGVRDAIAGDLEGDGDLDLIFATDDAGVRLMVNRGNRTFFEVLDSDGNAPLAQQVNIVDMAIADFDRDLDLDVITLDSNGRVGLIENLLHLQFRYRELDEIASLPGASSIAVEDVDGNVAWDLIVGSDSMTTFHYGQTADRGTWTLDESETVKVGGLGFATGDFDNDSWLEVARPSPNNSQLIRTRAGAILDKDDVSFGAITNLTVADFNRDGKTDIVGLFESTPTLAINTTTTDASYIDVRFRGIDDNNANSGRVNHYAIGSVLELRYGPHYRAKTITSPTTHFGLGNQNANATLRAIFPNGLTQTVADPQLNTLVEEEQTLKGSCPYVYTWDGEKFAFVTDCLWAAPLGLQVAAGVVAKDRPWEYLKIDGDFVEPRDGHYELRLTEELWEVAYFDHVSLVAVDHPKDVQIWTNEKVGPPEIAKPQTFAFGRDQRIAPTRASKTNGSDVSSELASIDGKFVKGFDRRLRQGLCPPHWIDIDFGKLAQPTTNGERLYATLTGWILPTDTSLNIQIDQNPELPTIEFPSLWVPDTQEASGWRKAIPFIGFPGGKTKTIVIDVTDVIDRDDPRIRVRTSAQIYWDAAELVIQSHVPKVKTHRLRMVDAHLDYHGFSRRSKPSNDSPETYDYVDKTTNPRWPPLGGFFTQFGNCKSLLESWDDVMVVMGSGDEIQLRFASPKQPVPPGWKRDLILHCVGWDKDADLNTLTGQNAGPLPFKSMESYPPTRKQSNESEIVLEKNRKHLNRTQSFRKFWSREL